MAADDPLPPSPARDREALVALVNRHRPLMLRTARRYLRQRHVLKGLCDEEDAVEGALAVLWADVESGKPLGIDRPSGLWRVFTRALANWISAASQREAARKRGGSGIACAGGAAGATSNVSATSPDELDLLESTAPQPETTVMEAELVERLLGLLDSEQRAVVRLRVEGLSVPKSHRRWGCRIGQSSESCRRSGMSGEPPPCWISLERKSQAHSASPGTRPRTGGSDANRRSDLVAALSRPRGLDPATVPHHSSMRSMSPERMLWCKLRNFRETSRSCGPVRALFSLIYIEGATLFLDPSQTLARMASGVKDRARDEPGRHRLIT